MLPFVHRVVTKARVPGEQKPDGSVSLVTLGLVRRYAASRYMLNAGVDVACVRFPVVWSYRTETM